MREISEGGVPLWSIDPFLPSNSALKRVFGDWRKLESDSEKENNFT
jgi:hypothetical protein